jgi:hypothetical protein
MNAVLNSKALSMQTLHSRSARRRKRSLGAVLAEAAVVMPVLVLFFSCSAYIARMYQSKQLKQTQGRTQSMTSASHGCQGGGQTQTAGTDFGPEKVDQESGTDKSKDTQGSSSRTMNLAVAGDESIIREGPFSGKINTSSNFMCNEVPGSGGAQERAIDQGLDEFQGTQ